MSNAKRQLKKIQEKQKAKANVVFEEQLEASELLYEFVSNYITKNKISCPEAIHQCDHLTLDATFFMEKCCEIVGFIKSENEGS